MTVRNFSSGSIGNYVREMRFIFEYYPDVSPAYLTAEQIEVCICYIKKTFNKRWKEAVKAKHKFLFPTKAVQEVYRAYFLKQLQQQIDKGIVRMSEEQHKDWLGLRTRLYKMEWIAYFKEPNGRDCTDA